MSNWLVIQVSDESGSEMTPSNVTLRDDSTSHSFNDVSGQGLSLQLSSVSAGDYQLEIELPDRPPLVLSMGVKDRKSGKVAFFRGHSPACCTLTTQRVTTGSSSSRTLHALSLKLKENHEEIVLVAGWDYSGGADNTLYAKTWRDDLYAQETYVTGTSTPLSRSISDHTVVTLFDFKSGNRIRWIKGRRDWHEMDSELQGSVPTHTANYKSKANKKKRHDDDSISILHVYDYIADLGKAAAGCLLSVDMFSHAWAGGPILVNTNQEAEFSPGGARELERDPGDKDGRTKDFSRTNLPRLSEFKQAFASDAVAKIWGCFATTDYRRLVRGAAKAPDKTTKFEVTLSDGRVLEVTGQRVETYFKDRILKETYMAKMADATGITVYGAPPGMGANLRNVGRRNYMFVSQSDYRLEYQWFKDALGLEPDESGYFPFEP